MKRVHDFRQCKIKIVKIMISEMKEKIKQPSFGHGCPRCNADLYLQCAGNVTEKKVSSLGESQLEESLSDVRMSYDAENR